MVVSLQCNPCSKGVTDLIPETWDARTALFKHKSMTSEFAFGLFQDLYQNWILSLI